MKAYFFVIAFVGLSKVSSSNKSSFKSPRPASGSSSSSSLLSFFTLNSESFLCDKIIILFLF